MPPKIRIPSAEDFQPLSPDLTLSLHFPSPPESTQAILLLLHGLGDSEVPFATFARNISLPGVLAISIRGINPLPPSLLGLPLDTGPTRHFHWGDDLSLAPGNSGELDPDPGFEKAAELVLGRLIREVLVGKCGWEMRDIMVFGFGQGGSLALGLASRVRMGERVAEIKDGNGEEEGKVLKGVVSVGGPLPVSMVPTVSGRRKAKTPVLLCCGRASEVVDGEAVDLVKREFEDVEIVRWKKAEDSMPSNREEMLPIMKFFAGCLNSGW